MREAAGWQKESVSSYYNELKYSCYSKHEYKQHVKFVSRHFTILYLKVQTLEALHNLQYFPPLSDHQTAAVACVEALNDFQTHTHRITTPWIPVTLWMNCLTEIPRLCLIWTDQTFLRFLTSLIDELLGIFNVWLIRRLS